jgi:hypothetical protein
LNMIGTINAAARIRISRPPMIIKNHFNAFFISD